MLTNISWQTYFIFWAFTLTVYYVFIGIIFYKIHGIKFLKLSFQQPGSGLYKYFNKNYNSSIDEEKLLEAVQKFSDNLRFAIYANEEKGNSKEALAQVLKNQLNEHNELEETLYKPAINNLIIEESKMHSSISFSEDEVNGLWKE